MRLITLLLALVLVVSHGTSAAAAETVVIGLSDSPSVLEAMRTLDEWLPAELGTRLSPQELRAALLGSTPASTQALEELETSLMRANELEGEFNTSAAQRLRSDVLQEYERQATQNAALGTLAARALHDRAAAWLSDSHRDDAIDDFVEAQRRFPGTGLDTRRHPPQAADLFRRAFRVLQTRPLARLTVTTNAPGNVRLDGRDLGPSTGTQTYEVPAGHYILWIKDATRVSLAHPIDVRGETSASVDFALESQLAFRVDSVTARCAPGCESTLHALTARASVTRALGVRDSTGNGIELLIVDATGASRTEIVKRHADPVAQAVWTPMPAPAVRGLSAWSFVPGGVGQVAQGRPLMASVVGVATAGAIVWHVLAVQGRQEGHEDDSRTQQNISAGVLVGVVVAGVVEAIVHDLRSGD